MRTAKADSSAHEGEQASQLASVGPAPMQKLFPFVLADPSHGITRLAMMEAFFEWAPHWHHHAHVEVLIVLEGSLTVRFRRHDEVVLNPAQALVIPADENHLSGPSGKQRRLLAMNLRVAELPPNDLHRYLSRHPQPQAWRCDPDALRRSVRELRLLAAAPDRIAGSALMRAAWGLLVPETVTAAQPPDAAFAMEAAEPEVDRRLLYLETRMQNQMNRPYDGQALADSVQLSVSQMSRLFNRYRGVSPLRRFQTIRLEQAEQYLIYSTLSIKQIAVRCGFASPDHFTRLFKDRTGETPRAFRLQHQSSRLETEA